MKLNKVDILNKGMSQDLSISKEVLEYAFENKNIRLQALDDGTLMTITNIRGPKKIIANQIKGAVVGKCYTGDYLVLFTVDNTGDMYSKTTSICRIYRVDLNKSISEITVNLLYEGDDLYFEKDRTFDTLFYYENKNVQKVYWTESWYTDDVLQSIKDAYPNKIVLNNTPRVINIITEGERVGKGFTKYTSNKFDFYPSSNKVPRFKILKDYNTFSELPAGTIQYYISYYFENGAETLITNLSSSFTIDYENRGANADESGMCSFRLTLSNIDTQFDYFRIYSAIRTTKEGPVLVKIVSDVLIQKDIPNAEYVILDSGINQETLDPSQLFYIGGSPLYAKTLELKDNTLFLGNLKTPLIDIPESLINAFDHRKIYLYKIKNKNKEYTIPLRIKENGVVYTTYDGYQKLGYTSFPSKFDETTKNNFSEQLIVDDLTLKKFNISIKDTLNLEKVSSIDMEFSRSKINGKYNPTNNTSYKSVGLLPNQFTEYYNYRLQTRNSEYDYKTFKKGEVYRFGIQFQNKYGQWTSVIWIGDKECITPPIVDNDNHLILLNNAVYKFPQHLVSKCKDLGFINYRIVMADPESSNGRRIQAQGVVCPTLFSPGQRALGLHSISSWIMRPRGGDCSYHHFEPITSSLALKGSEIYGFDTAFILKPDVEGFLNDKCKMMKNEKGEYIQEFRPADELGKKLNGGGAHYTSPFYGIKAEDDNKPRFLITQLSIHSGKRLTIKTTEVASDFGTTNFWDDSIGKYSYTYTPEKQYDPEPFNDFGSKGWSDIHATLVREYQKKGWDTRLLPSANTLKKVGNKQFWGELLTLTSLITTVITTIALVVGAITFTGGTLSSGIIGAATMILGSLTVGDLAILSTAGALSIGLQDFYGKLEKDWQKELAGKGYIVIPTDANNKQSDLKIFGESIECIPKELASKGLNAGQKDYDWLSWDGNGYNAIHFVLVVPLAGKSYLNEEIQSEFNRFYVDESIVTFHSPEIENCRDKNLKFRIVGTAPINASYANIEIQTSSAPYIILGGIDNSVILKYRNSNVLQEENMGLYADYFYWDSTIKNDGLEETESSITDDCLDQHYFTADASLYKVYMWDKSSGASITGGTKDMKELNSGGQTISVVPSILKEKTFFNQLNSFGTNYFNTPIVYDNPGTSKLFDSVEDRVYVFNKAKPFMYAGNYDHLIGLQKACNLNISYSYDEDGNLTKALKYAPYTKQNVRIKYKSSPHIVFDLNGISRSEKKLLPRFGSEIKYGKAGNYKDGKTHSWVLRDRIHDEFSSIDSCWTESADWYNSGIYLVAKYKAELTSDLSINRRHAYNLTALDLQNYLSNDELLNIAFNLKKGRKVHFVLLRIYYNNTYNESSHIDGRIKEHLFLKEFNTELCRENLDIVNIKDSIKAQVYYDKYAITSLELETILNGKGEKVLKTDSLGNFIIYNTSFTDLGNTDSSENVYIYKDTMVYGRFTLISTKSTYTQNAFKRYVDFPIKYNQPVLNEKTDSKYLFVGELYYDIPERDLYGGYGKQQLNNLQWYPISAVTPIGKDVKKTIGDTYYQRYDCLKISPYTEEDTNKVVDITSFMVESHKNLDMRTDKNRDFYNIMSRPENFNKFNPVYDSKSNIFQYTTKISDYTTTEYCNQITWSLTKNFLGRVDSWTNINIMSLTNCGSGVTKLKNYLNTLVALNENAVEIVNYNNKNFISTESDFIEVANSSKVDGTTKLYGVYGTTNMSTLITERGLYFIDDKEKSIIRLSSDNSLTKLGMSKMDSWLKNNISKGTYSFYNIAPFYLEYDPVHKDVYIMNEDTCLIYNEQLDAFTSFVEYPKCYTLFPIDGLLMALATLDYKTYSIYHMFNGKYNTTFELEPIGYSVNYRINPSPYADKVFSNVEFIADCSNASGLTSDLPFDDIQVWNEYQDTGEKTLNYQRNNISNLKLKFRIWRADIPRDGGKTLGGNRIRNPWINMKLKKNPTQSDYKFELHSMNVLYMM